MVNVWDVLVVTRNSEVDWKIERLKDKWPMLWMEMELKELYNGVSIR